MRIILDFLDARDQMTARHSAAVARYARRIAEAAGCPESEQRLVHTAALYHDVGKVMFADRMFKAGKLTDEEWEIVKRHPERGAELVGHLPNHEDVAAIILAHHERIDGRGYPRGLAGEDIPRLSRMISIADTYDVMTGRDSYRQPVSSAEAIEELRRVSGAQLDGASSRSSSSRCSRSRTSPSATATTPTSRPSSRSSATAAAFGARSCPRRSSRRRRSKPLEDVAQRAYAT